MKQWSLQSRTRGPSRDEWSSRLPTDTKRENYGMIKDQLVCHDWWDLGDE